MYKTISLLLMCVVYVSSINAQKRPQWVENIESSIKQQLPDLDIGRSKYEDKEGWIVYSFASVYKGNGGRLEIECLDKLPNFEDYFQGFVTIYNNGKGPNTITKDVKEYGDEGNLWFGAKPGSWHRLYFRRKPFIVNLTFEEPVSRKLAVIIDSQAMTTKSCQ